LKALAIFGNNGAWRGIFWDVLSTENILSPIVGGTKRNKVYARSIGHHFAIFHLSAILFSTGSIGLR